MSIRHGVMRVRTAKLPAAVRVRVGFRSAASARCSKCSRPAARAPRHTLGARHDRGRPRRADLAAPAPTGTLIYLHGGAYALGSAQGYRGLVARLAAAAGMTAVVPDYSRAPEAQYPVALEEMVAVYTGLLEDGLRPENDCHCW